MGHVHFQWQPPSQQPRPNSHRLSSDLSSEADLTTLSNGQRLPPLIHTRPHHHPQELKRPDSVITTSSIVSSDTASQAGDSSTETTSGPPSVYVNVGLYGSIPAKK